MAALIHGQAKYDKYAGQVVDIWNRQNGSQCTHDKIRNK